MLDIRFWGADCDWIAFFCCINYLSQPFMYCLSLLNWHVTEHRKIFFVCKIALLIQFKKQLAVSNKQMRTAIKL